MAEIFEIFLIISAQISKTVVIKVANKMISEIINRLLVTLWDFIIIYQSFTKN